MDNKTTFFVNNSTLFIFLFFVLILAILGIIYCHFLAPSKKKIDALVEKFAVGSYKIPTHVAERYLTWYGMRTFFFALDYSLTLLGMVASLMTVFYAATNTQSNKSIIVFLSLLSLTFTIANIFINAGTKAHMAQHAWRGLDTCIMGTIHRTDIIETRKNAIIVSKVAEMEQYIESFEH